MQVKATERILCNLNNVLYARVHGVETEGTKATTSIELTFVDGHKHTIFAHDAPEEQGEFAAMLKDIERAFRCKGAYASIWERILDKAPTEEA